MKAKKNLGLTVQLTLITIVIIALGAQAMRAARAQSVNRLAIGTDAKVRGPLVLYINPPSALNFLSRQDILSRRRDFVMQHPELLVYQYAPTGQIFDAMEDGKPWWGMKGQIFYGAGQRSIEGDAEESRFLNNPFLLVQANLILEKIPYNSNAFASQEELDRTDIPLECGPGSAVIYPAERREEINYNLSEFLEKSSRATRAKVSLPDAKLDLVAYNARDLGFNYLAVSKAYSVNINKVGNIVDIDQYIHTGGTCGYPGGCNNMSPYNDKLFDLGVTKLPARACVHLWKNRPRSESDNPDFQILINLN